MLKEFTTEITIFDSVFNRPAHGETGLYKVIFERDRELLDL